jgi:hypothetical protein
MLTVILTALKVIGIILGSLLGLLLVLILMILFLPVRYLGDGFRNRQEMGLQIKLRWLFGLVRVSYCYPQPGNWIVKVLCFTVYKSGGGTSPGKPQKTNTSKRTKKRKQKEDSPINRGNDQQIEFDSLDLPTQSENTPDENTYRIQKSTNNKESAGSGELVLINESVDTDELAQGGESTGSNNSAGSDKSSSSGDPTGSDESMGNKLIAFVMKWLAFFQKKLSDGEYYLNLLREDETRLLFLQTKDRLRNVIRSISPRKLKANIQFGTGAPDTTGMAYGVCSMLYPYFGKYIIITPNFDEAMLVGDVSLSGRAVGWVIIVSVLKISFDKGIRRFLKKWKREVA